MNLKEMIESASEIVGSQKELAITLGQHPNALTAAKKGHRGLPADACGKLAEILNIDRWAVICASELNTETSPEKRAYFSPFVQHVAGILGTICLVFVTNVLTPSPAQAAWLSQNDGGMLYIMLNEVLRRIIRTAALALRNFHIVPERFYCPG